MFYDEKNYIFRSFCVFKAYNVVLLHSYKIYTTQANNIIIINMKRLFLSIAVCITITVSNAQTGSNNFNVAKNLDLITSIYKYLDIMYVDSLNADEVVGTGINAMLRSLDPYTEYYPADKTRDLREMVTGAYAGIGSIIRYNNQLKRVIIEEPYEGLPADEAGLKRGDVILSIDGEDMTDKEQSYVSNHLRGEAGSTFVIRIYRPSLKKEMELKITRRAIQLPAVPYYGLQKDGVGYIALSQFTEGCSRDVRRAFIDMKKQGMKALVFDLRGNGGGSEMEAVNIVNMFVPKGKLIVSNRGKLERANHDYLTTVEPLDTVMPVVVLVNGSSASASEITSGALQDLDRAVILGTRTYGKGLVQMTMDLPYNAQLKLTTNKYYIPSGRCIQAVNYKHSDGGTVEHVADPLTKVFYTAHGREVRDGGGITPDVEVKSDSLTNIVYSLMYLRDSTELVLNYELDYIASHPTIAPAEEFKLTDDDFNDLKRRVLESGYKYDQSTETYLDNLEKIARFEGYYDNAREEFEALRSKLRHDVEHDLDFNRDVLMRLIANDIVASYYYQRGTIANTLAGDKQMSAAVKLLLNPEEYSSLLRPKE